MNIFEELDEIMSNESFDDDEQQQQQSNNDNSNDKIQRKTSNQTRKEVFIFVVFLQKIIMLNFCVFFYIAFKSTFKTNKEQQ